jgi:hypothetical protein
MVQETVYSGMINSLGGVASGLIELRDIAQQILDLTEHVHESHWHGATHCVHERDKKGNIFLNSVDESAILTVEYNNRLDKDDNDLIFGWDFIIDKNDVNCPPSLRSFESIMISDGMKVPKKISWNEYQETLPWT